MKMAMLYEAILSESIHTAIFVDFDQTFGHFFRPSDDIDEGLEVIDTIKRGPRKRPSKLVMRNGWKEFLHALNAMDHDGNIYIYSGGGGQDAFPTLFKMHPDLKFVNVIRSIKEHVKSHPHSILIDENIMAAYTEQKLKMLGLSKENLIDLVPFMGQMDNELSITIQKVQKRIKELESKYRL